MIPGKGDAIERFFSTDRRVDKTVAGIVSRLAERDKIKPFALDMIKQVGFPHWEKSLLSKRRGTPAARTTSEEDTSYIYTPFTSDDYQNVQAVFITRITNADTSYKMLRADDYKDYPDESDSGATATDVALMFLSFENMLFERTHMEIKDYKKLFFHSYHDNTLLYTSQVSMAARTCSSTSTIVYTVCTSVTQSEGFDQEQYDTGILPHDGKDNTEYPTCKTYFITATDYYECGGGGGGGNGSGWSGSGGAGGGSANPPGGLTGPNDPHPFDHDPDGAIKNNHVHGPVSTLGGWSPPPITLMPPESVDSALLRTSTAANLVADSMMHLSHLGNNVEFVTTIVQRHDGSVYTRNMRTDFNPYYSSPDFTVSPGEIVIGTMHTHPRDSVSDQSAPSGGDVDGLRFNLRQNFVLYAECGNVRFALVIEDVAKATAFMKNVDPAALNQQLSNAAQLVPNWFHDWQNATKVALKDYLGSVSSSGIGFYVSNNTSKTTYTKLNP